MILRFRANFQIRSLLELGIQRSLTTSRKCTMSLEEYQFLQKSKIPTLHFQKSLPRLPVPQIEKTCDRYLAALKPILTDNEYNDTEKLVKYFKANEGKNIHEELVRDDLLHPETSYISKPWFDMYLSDRTPLPINYNPVIVFNKSEQPENNNQLIRASNMLISSLRFLNSLRKNILAPDVYHLNPKKSDTELFRNVTKFLPPSVSWYGAYLFKAFPLDMSQYPHLFCSTRIPKLDRDVLYKDESARHILVLRRGHFFTFDVLDKNGSVLPPEDIYKCLKLITEMDLKPDTKYLGYFTTENRDIWAKARAYIESSSEENSNCLQAVDSALFALCLDDEELGDDYRKVMVQFLHGHGFNRWFDKSFSLLISKDGTAAVNFEHSWGDGVAVLRFFQDVYKDTNNNLFVHSNTNSSWKGEDNPVRELKFTLDEKITAEIEVAKEKFENTCKSLAINVAQTDKLGKPHCKTASISPDSIMQLAFQIAYHKVYGNFVATYESCSTAAFKHGRTETIRPCTFATKQFALNMNKKSRPSREELLELMKQCSTIHGNLTKEAAMGEGFDRHLFGLKNLCIRTGRRLPDLFIHDSYKRINYNIISTSTLASDAVLMGGFGPVVPDGFGLGYVIKNNMCGAVVSSYVDQKNGSDFAQALESTFNELASIIC
ncbi:UNVERIFIED_CONTAM: hypothetical protein PYX00_010655 [Menopon gallinae]|uniref:Choline/carnitine acyltransferase domain-containing protein n=1 Tax=Menopon gallinae TaxID=328185 RepID=A0AAW2HG63_9NEOP